MSAFEEKTLIIENKAIKIGIILVLTLFGSFFIINGVLAETIFFDEDFETYELGDLGGQGDWILMPAKLDWQVTNEKSYSGEQSITFEQTGYGHHNLKSGEGIFTTTRGIISFWFYSKEKPTIWYFRLKQGEESFVLNYPRVFDPYEPESDSKIYLQGGIATSTSEIVAYDYPAGKWNNIEMVANITYGGI